MPRFQLHPPQQRALPSQNHDKSSAAMRVLRPALRRRGTPTSISKPGLGYQKREGKAGKTCAPCWEMASSFLNFCATCEKQILTPDNSLLYCSESCRRKDSCKPLSASPRVLLMYPSMAPSSAPSMSSPVIVAPMTPTRPGNSLIQLPCDLGSSDGSTLSEHPLTTDIFRNEGVILPAVRHSSSASLSAVSIATPLPSLAHSPSSTASSLSSNASNFMGTRCPSPRPLPPRRNPSTWNGQAAKSLDLVVPQMRPALEDICGSGGEHELLSPASSSAWEDTH